MAERAQLLLKLNKAIFGKYTPYFSSYTNIVLHHCWVAHDAGQTYNGMYDDSTVEMMHYELSEIAIVGSGGGVLKKK